MNGATGGADRGREGEMEWWEGHRGLLRVQRVGCEYIEMLTKNP